MKFQQFELEYFDKLLDSVRSRILLVEENLMNLSKPKSFTKMNTKFEYEKTNRKLVKARDYIIRAKKEIEELG
ncbi:MAG: hypothetical protein ACFFG0_18910 [Candidatus Thorarchaeota archaeon]